MFLGIICILAIFYPPSEIDLGLCLAVFAGSGGKYLYFTELAERVEYGNYYMLYRDDTRTVLERPSTDGRSGGLRYIT